MKMLQIIMPMYPPMPNGEIQTDETQAICFIFGILAGLALGFLFGIWIHNKIF